MGAKFCMSCGSAVLPGKKFCMNCGAAIDAAAPIEPVSPNQYGGQPPPAQTQPERPHQQQDAGVFNEPASVKSLGVLGYLGYLLLMSLPIAGLVVSIVWSAKPLPAARNTLAKAMIAFNAIWSLVFVVFMALLYGIISQVANISVTIFGLRLL